ncbi:MAG: 50S ribosome-binding GTPase [Phycisphaerae bacterium]|nr:50S ribosome-binding GTPase [Phycisphaerae bacterium]
MTSREKTTASLQTPPGRGGIALISLVGPATVDVLQRVFQPRKTGANLPTAGELQLGFLIDGTERLDEVIVSLNTSSAEINIHGGSGIAHRAMKLLVGCGVEVTAPHCAGFPKSHPRWDNPAVGAEMLDALAAGRSLKVTRSISHQWAGGISKLAREILDNPSPDSSKLLRAAADGFATMQKLLDPMEVVLAGPPNAGKSTLGNAIVARPVSIVHDHAGTTRDWIRELALIDGIPIWCTDTAGLWTTDHTVDAEAVRRAWDKIAQADLVVLVSPGGDIPIELPQRICAKKILHVETKSDIHGGEKSANPEAVKVSGMTGDGMDALGKAILKSLELENFEPAIPRAFTKRQAELLNRAAKAIDTGDSAKTTATLKKLLGET